MLNYYPDIYRQLGLKIDECRELHCHLLLITLPGIGTTHLLRHYLAYHPQVAINFINVPDQPITTEFNFLDLDFDTNHDALSQALTYFQQADYRQKFALILNYPALLSDPTYLQSQLPRRLLTRFYLPAFSASDLDQFLRIDFPQLSDKDSQKIYELSGGICRFAKYLLANRQCLDLSPAEIVQLPEIAPIITPTIDAIRTSPPDVLTKLNILQDGQYHSSLVAAALNLTNISPQININSDLTFSENGQPSPHPLNKIESKILNYLLQNDYFISREKVAEFKWGENQYDEFSDLAISKTMRRLKEKLTVSTLKTIPKTGWQLQSK